MNIILSSKAGELNYIGESEKGFTQNFSGSGAACSPMETLLMSAAACSSIDIEILLKKMRQNLKSLEVVVSSERRKEISPAKFTAIHLAFKLKGEIKEEKAKKAVEMSLEKMCSVTHSLDPTIKITSSIELNS
jgi:putative redox protein